MLCQFSAKNYKSFRDEMIFDMSATSILEHSDKIIYTEYGDSFLPISSIYGPNGGGKSNVLDALYTLVAKVLSPLCATYDKTECEHKARRTSVKPFSLSAETIEEPTEFEIYFRTKVAEYRYILHIKRDVIVKECLSRVKFDTGRKSALFTRDENAIILKGVFSKIKISDEISETLPLLSYLGITYKKNETIADVISWFELSIDFLNYSVPLQDLRVAVIESKMIKELILNMIKEMDLDIEDFRIEEKDESHVEIYTTHIVNGHSTELTLSEESSGTKKLFGLLPIIITSILNGTTLVIDELDAKIHPVLLRYIIMLFTNMDINKHGAQLIFTSHDLSTMSSELFRRDEIWFVAKGAEQNSKLYSLVEFKTSKGKLVRADARYDKQYLEGKYGANPYLKKIIDWDKVKNAE